jgi:hypothetical protein
VCYSGRIRASKHKFVKFSTFNLEWAVYDKLLLKSNVCSGSNVKVNGGHLGGHPSELDPGATGLQEPNGKGIDLPYDKNRMENVLLSRYTSFVAL